MVHDISPPVDRLGHEHAESEAAVSWERATGLPSWPLALVFAGYPIWWALGIGDMALPLVAVVMVHQLLRRRVRPVVPAGFGVWLLFLAWVAFSVVRLDSGGRLLGFGYRGLIYVAATIAFIYVYSDRRTFSLERVAGLLTGFWGVVVAGGYLGLIWPLFTLRTPLAHLLPEGLLANEMVSEMAIRRLTEFNPDAWTVLFPRPSAPFLYTNGWGSAYSMLTPVVIAYAFHLSGWRRIGLAAAVVASLVPALLSLNRGMFIGLGIAGLYIAIRSFAAGYTRAILAVAAAGLIAAFAFAVLPVQDRLSLRLESSGTNEDRSSIYEETLERSLESPILGHGAPRPSEASGLPLRWDTWPFLDGHVLARHSCRGPFPRMAGRRIRAHVGTSIVMDRTCDAHLRPRHRGPDLLLRLRHHGPRAPHDDDRRRMAIAFRGLISPRAGPSPPHVNGGPSTCQ
jgi:polysaccharide biosynthesis protein PslJ